MSQSSASPTTTVSIAEQLLSEASQLGTSLTQVLSEIKTLAPEVNAVLASAIASSSSDRTKSIFQETIEKHTQIINAGANLPTAANVIIDRFKKANPAAAFRDVMSRLAKVDPEKLANEELLAECTRARQTVECGMEVWAIQVSAVQIPLYSLPISHLKLLHAFLNRPSTLDKTFSNAAALFKALAKDVVGEAVPFLGVLEIIFELTAPAIERDVKSMRQATHILDRLFRLDDSLNNVVGHARFVEAAIRLADDATRTNSAHFERDATWLIAVLAAAERK